MKSSGRETVSTIMVTVGLLSVMIAAFLPLIHVAQDWMRYLYAAGALILLIGRFVAPSVKDAPLRLRRLLHMEIWTAIIFIVGAVFLFLPSAGGKDWLAFTFGRRIPDALYIHNDSASETKIRLVLITSRRKKFLNESKMPLHFSFLANVCRQIVKNPLILR